MGHATFDDHGLVVVEYHEREEAREDGARGGVEAHEGYEAEAARGGYWRVGGHGDCVRVEGRAETYRALVDPGVGRGVAGESAGAHACEGACSACLHWVDRVGRGRTVVHRVPEDTERPL